MAFVGIILPGMLNMTAVSVSVQRGRRAGLQFVGGASITTGIQSFIALLFADFLLHNPRIIHGMQQVALWLFLILAVVFFYKARKGEVAKARKSSGRKTFGAGFGLGFANALAIPYFLAVSSWLMSKGQVNNGLSGIAMFAIGASAGAFIVFVLYVWSADWVSRHAAWMTRNINYIMSGFFLFLAGLQSYHLFG